MCSDRNIGWVENQRSWFSSGGTPGNDEKGKNLFLIHSNLLLPHTLVNEGSYIEVFNLRGQYHRLNNLHRKATCSDTNLSTEAKCSYKSLVLLAH